MLDRASKHSHRYMSSRRCIRRVSRSSTQRNGNSRQQQHPDSEPEPEALTQNHTTAYETLPANASTMCKELIGFWHCGHEIRAGITPCEESKSKDRKIRKQCRGVTSWYASGSPRFHKCCSNACCDKAIRKAFEDSALEERLQRQHLGPELSWQVEYARLDTAAIAEHKHHDETCNEPVRGPLGSVEDYKREAHIKHELPFGQYR